MARNFVKATANYMSLGVGTLGPLMNGAAFISAHCWVMADAISAGVNDNAPFAAMVGANLSFLTFRIDGSVTPNVLRVGGRSANTDGFATRNATSSFTTATWHSCGGVLDFAGDIITPYFNGAAENSGAAVFANASFTDLTTGRTAGDAIGGVGAPPGSTAPQLDGRMAEMSFWYGTRALTAAEFVTLAQGYSAELVGVGLSRISFRLMGKDSPERDIFQGLSGTITGTIASSVHPRILRPSAKIYGFPSATGGQNLTPGLYADSDTFFAATVAAGAVALTPALFADADTFFSAAVAGGAVNLAPSLFVDADTFHAATVAAGAVNLAPALFVDGDTFYSATVAGGSLTLAPSLFVDADAFFAPTVSPGSVALTPSIYTDADTFHAATIAAGYNLAPAAYADADAFYAATVAQGAGNLSPSLYADPDTFYAAIVAGGSSAVGHLLAELSTQPSLSGSLSLHASLQGTLSIN